MGGTSSKKAVVKAESAHEESGGFHLLEVNSPVHISGSTWALIAIVAGLFALAFYVCHRRDIKEEKALVYKREQDAKNDARHHVVPIESPRQPLPPADTAAFLLPLLDTIARRTEPHQYAQALPYAQQAAPPYAQQPALTYAQHAAFPPNPVCALTRPFFPQPGNIVPQPPLPLQYFQPPAAPFTSAGQRGLLSLLLPACLLWPSTFATDVTSRRRRP